MTLTTKVICTKAKASQPIKLHPAILQSTQDMREDIQSQLRILSLDGGETRCISQLEILRELMHRIKIDTGIEHRPFDYFHWIGGVGAGGVVAMLLVTFKMDVEEALATFARICTSVLSNECSPAERASKLEAITSELLDEHGVAAETKLLKEDERTIEQSTSCKLGLFYLSAVNLNRCTLFRNYISRQASYNPTVVQAMRAVWATPGLFPSVQIGPGIVQEEIVSAVNGFNNPTLEVLKEIHQTFGPEAIVSCLLSLGTGRAPIRSVSSDGSGTSRTLEQLAIDCDRTAEEVGGRIDKLDVYFRFSVDRGLQFDTPYSPTGDITAHTGQYLLDKSVSSGLDTCIRSCERKSRVTLEQLYHTQRKSSTSLRGLPPLSAYFIMRQESMNFLKNRLVNPKTPGQRLAIVAGMGGSGKTQLTLKFARDFEDSYQVVLFIDASSVDNIKKGLVMRVRALERGYKPETLDDALEALSNAEDRGIRNWLIIYDNADDPELDLRSYIPACEHGAVLVSTRNTTLQHMAPEGYLELDVMSPEEAITALLQAALPSGAKPTPRDRTAAEAISRQLGYLPIAIIQAGCYIRQQQCLYEYEDRLKNNRKATLERPARNQRDTLKYGHSVYASLDITVGALSRNALHILSLLSCVHFANFPRPLFGLAAESGFQFEYQKLFDRPASFQATIDFLLGIFCPNGTWDEDVLANALEELQQYSLVAVVPSTSVVALRLHPLVHGWAYDRLSPDDQELYREATVRLLAYGAEGKDPHIYDYLTSHVMSLFKRWPTLHFNDRMAFLKILEEDSDSADAGLILEQSQTLYEQLKTAIGGEDIRTTRVALFLAEAYGHSPQASKREEILTEVLRTREALLGREDLETVGAMMSLANAYNDQGRYKEAEGLLVEILSVRARKLGEYHKDTAETMELMARIHMSQGRITEATKLLETVVATRTTIAGRAHQSTIFSMTYLSMCLDREGRYTEADALRQEILVCETTLLGPQHVETLAVLMFMGLAYVHRRKFIQVEKYCGQAVAGLKEGFGSTHSGTMETLELLAKIYHLCGRLSKSESCWRELLECKRKVEGDSGPKALDALSSLAQVVHAQGRLGEAKEIWSEEIERRKTTANGKMSVEQLNAVTSSVPFFYAQGRFEELEALITGLIESRKQVQGEDHPDTLDAIQVLAKTKLERNEHAEAESIFQKLLDKRRIIQGEKYVDTVISLGWLSRAIEKQGRLEEAAKLREQEINLLFESSKFMEMTDAREQLVNVYLKLKRFFDAERVAREMTKLSEEMEPMDPIIFVSRATMSWVLHHMGKFGEAAILTEQVLKERLTLWGEQHLLVAHSRSRLASTYEAMGRYDEATILVEQAISVQRELLWHGHEMLEETQELQEKLDHRPGPVASQLSEGLTLADLAPRRPPVRGESIDIEGYVSPGENSPSITSPPRPLVRPFSPFQQRNKFGRAPNSWSMFM